MATLNNLLLINKIRDNHELNSSEKVVAFALASRRNAQLIRCNPSIRKIAEDTSLSLSSVRRVLESLIEHGIITRIYERKAGSIVRCHYFFLSDIEEAKELLTDKTSSIHACKFFDSYCEFLEVYRP